MMKHRWLGIVGAVALVGIVFPTLFIAQTAQTAQTEQAPGPYARIAILRALDGQTVDLEAGYIRHLEWHRQAKDTFRWYSYSVWASTERQRWLIYATFGHTAATLSNPVSPAEDERDNTLNVLPHAQFLGNGVYEFLPALSRGNGVPTPTLRAEYTTVELNQGAGKAFEAALAAEQSKLQGETLWYRMVVGGNTPCYVRLRPRATLAAILNEHADQALPDKLNSLISKMTVETLNLRPDMLVNVTPEPAR
jgi:acetyl esterase/lipase